MIKNIRKHLLHYFVYLLIFGGGLLLVLSTRGDSSLQALLIIMIGFVYFMGNGTSLCSS